MSFCSPCGAQVLPKWEQHIVSLYPAASDKQVKQQGGAEPYARQQQYTTNGSQLNVDALKPKTMSDVTKYAEMYPQRLPKMTGNLVQRTLKHLRKGRPCLATIGIYALIAIVDACHTDDVLTLYDEQCKELILQAHSSTYAQHCQPLHTVLLLELIRVLMKYQRDGNDWLKYESLWGVVAQDMQQGDRRKSSNDKSGLNPHAVPAAALRATAAMIQRCETRQSVKHYQHLIPLVLRNTTSGSAQSATQSTQRQYTPPKNWLTGSVDETLRSIPTVQAAQVQQIAFYTYYTAVHTPTLEDLELFVQPTLQWLDSQQWQLPQELTITILTILCNESQLPYCDILIIRLLKHLESVDEGRTSRRRMSNQLQAGAPSSSVAAAHSSVELQPMQQQSSSQSSLQLRIIQTLTEVIKDLQNPIVQYQGVVEYIAFSVQEYADSRSLVDGYAQLLTAFVVKLTSSNSSKRQQENLLSLTSSDISSLHIVQLLLQRALSNTTPSTVQRDATLQLALRVAQITRGFHASYYPPEKLITLLVTAALAEPDAQRRPVVYDIMTYALLPSSVVAESTPAARRRQPSSAAQTMSPTADLTATSTSSPDTTFEHLLTRTNLTANTESAYVLNDQDHQWLLTVAYYELLLSIGGTDTAQQPRNNNPLGTKAHPQVSTAGSGSTTPTAIVCIWRLLIAALVQKPTPQRLAAQAALVLTVSQQVTSGSYSTAHRNDISTFVSAYLLWVGRIFTLSNQSNDQGSSSAARSLTEVVTSVLSGRTARGETSGSLRISDSQGLQAVPTGAVSSAADAVFSITEDNSQLVKYLSALAGTSASQLQAYKPNELQYLTNDTQRDVLEPSMSWRPSGSVPQETYHQHPNIEAVNNNNALTSNSTSSDRPVDTAIDMADIPIVLDAAVSETDHANHFDNTKRVASSSTLSQYRDVMTDGVTTSALNGNAANVPTAQPSARTLDDILADDSLGYPKSDPTDSLPGGSSQSRLPLTHSSALLSLPLYSTATFSTLNLKLPHSIGYNSGSRSTAFV